MKKYKIYINLSDKKLDLLDNNDKVIISFPIIYGRNSHLGNKEKEGDQRTPRGEFYLCSRNEKSKFKLFFGISYPTEEDAKRGYDKGLINKKQRDEIINAHNNNLRPPWNTPLGGEIGIHGGGIDRNGTRGCIGMCDEDVMKLREYVDVGNIVIIENGKWKMENGSRRSYQFAIKLAFKKTFLSFVGGMSPSR